jgi:hypothetical protein
MNPLEWFLAGGILMWPILLMVVVGLPIAAAALVMSRAKTERTLAVRRLAGVVLLVIAALCVAAGATGHLRAKGTWQAYAAQSNVTDPEFFRVADREARIPLEASIPCALLFALVGIVSLRKVPAADR